MSDVRFILATVVVLERYYESNYNYAGAEAEKLGLELVKKSARLVWARLGRRGA